MFLFELTASEAEVLMQLFVQALGPKPTIAPSTPDDEKVETSNRQKASLYMVRDMLHGPSVATCLEHVHFDLMLLSCSVDLRCFWFHEGDSCGSVQSLQTSHVVS